MRPGLLPLLACPACGGALEARDGDSLRCRGCAKVYPVVDGVPHLRPGDALEDGRVRRTAESFSWEWLRYPGARPVDRGILLEEAQLPPEAFQAKLVLDAGCGMGRFTLAALALGAEVVALDLSEALTRLGPELAKNPKLHVVQGDLLAPPLKARSFDIVFSHGVIHHTADTARAFERIAALVKGGGNLSVWVYGTPGPWSSFRTNPLRSGRTWLKAVLPAVWLGVWLRQIVSDALRVLTTSLPVPFLYALCYPLTLLGVVPVLKYLTYSVDPEFRVRLIENFDWLAPPFQTKHTKEEVRPWFERAGFTVISQLPHGVVPKVGFLGRRVAP